MIFMEAIKAISTMRMMLTDRQIYAVESIISHFKIQIS